MTNYSVFVVDDERVAREGVTLALKKEYQVQAFASAEAVIDALESDPPDLILLDVMLPGINGFEACKLLKADPDTKKIPVVFVTAKDHPEDIQAGKRAGGVDYLIKPFVGDELQKTVAKIIGKAENW